MFSYVTLEQRVPREHPLREIRKLTDEVLRSLSAEFDGLYSDLGRRSIAPEYVLRALLLQGRRWRNTPVYSGGFVMDSCHERRVRSSGSTSRPVGDRASGGFVPCEWSGEK